MSHLLSILKELQEKLKIDFIFKLTTIIVTIIILSSLVNFSFLNSLEKNMLQTINEDAYSKIKIAIIEYTKRQNQNLNIISDQIINDINNYYEDKDILREELCELKEESKLTDIFRTNIKGSSNIIIMNSDRVLVGNFHSYNMNSYYNKEYFNIDMEEFYSNFSNNTLLKSTFNEIFNLTPLKKDVLLGFVKEKKDLTLDEFNFDTIYNYISKNISLIEDFYFISYSYLTETGDIFNTPDYDIYGNPIENEKIVITKLFSFSDLDNPELISEINKLQEKKDLIEIKFENINYVLSICTFVTCFICGILFILILIVFDKRLKEIRK